MSALLLVNGNATRIPLADESISCVVTSPPYYALRDYGTAEWQGGDVGCDHVERKARNDEARWGAGGFGGEPLNEHADIDNMQYRHTCAKCGAVRIDQQLGLEATPADYLQRMVEVFREVKRVLRDDGQLFLNISDTRSKDRQWHGIPHRLVFALQADGWRYEDEIVWKKPNPLPGSQTNRFTRSHEFVFMLNKSKRAFFDMDAVREDFADARMGNPGVYKRTSQASKGTNNDRQDLGFLNNGGGWERGHELGGRKRRTVWSANPQMWQLRSDLSDDDRAYVLGELVQRGLLTNKANNNSGPPQSSSHNPDIAEAI